VPERSYSHTLAFRRKRALPGVLWQSYIAFMTETSERTPFDWETRFREDDAPWERDGLHPAFEHWRDSGAFDDISSVIIPGVGRSPELRDFAVMGKDTAGLDISQTALDWQHARIMGGHDMKLFSKENPYPGGVLHCGDALDWRPDEPMDAVYEQTFLCAIPPRLREAYERTLVEWLKPGGKLFALFMQKEERGGPPYGCALAAMHDLFPAERWDWPADEDFIAWPHPSLNGKPELGGVLVRR